MPLLWRATMFCALLPAAGAAQAPASSRETSILESATRHSDARVYSMSQIASFEGAESRAVFTGLAVGDPAQEDKKIRGVRIDFSDAGWTRAAYVDEGKLQPLKDFVDRLAVDVERMLPRLAPRSGEGYLGLCEFSDNSDAFPLEVDYCYSGRCSPGLRFTPPALVLFTGRKPSDLSAIIASTIESLRTH